MTVSVGDEVHCNLVGFKQGRNSERGAAARVPFSDDVYTRPLVALDLEEHALDERIKQRDEKTTCAHPRHEQEYVWIHASIRYIVLHKSFLSSDENEVLRSQELR